MGSDQPTRYGGLSINAQVIVRRFPAVVSLVEHRKAALVATAVGTGLLLLVVALMSRVALVYVLIAVFTIFAAIAPPRWGFAALFAFTGFSGVLKDIANYSIVSHLANDFVVAGLVVGHVVRARLGLTLLIPKSLPLRVPIAILVVGSVFLTLLSITPWSPTSPIQALGGWKAYVEPAILVPVAVAGLAEVGSLRPSMWAIVILGVANAAAAFAEDRVGPKVIAGWGPGFAHTVKGAVTFFTPGGISGTWRPFGLAQDAGAASLFEMSAAVLLVSVAMGRLKTHWTVRLISMALIPFLAFMVFRTGVRASAVALLIGLVLALVFARPKRLKETAIAVTLLAALIVGLGYIAYYVSTLTPALHVRMAGLLDFQTYLTSRGQLFQNVFGVAHRPLGYGMGKTVPSADMLAKLAGRKYETYANENMLLSMMLELGWFGGAVVITFVVEILAGMWRYLRRPVDEEVGHALLLCAVMLAIGLAGPVFGAVPSALILWALGAAALYRLSQSKAEKQVSS